MLVLSRRLRQRLVLLCPGGVEVVVELVDLSPTSAALGVGAPPSVKVYREELLLRGRVAGRPPAPEGAQLPPADVDAAAREGE